MIWQYLHAPSSIAACHPCANCVFRGESFWHFQYSVIQGLSVSNCSSIERAAPLREPPAAGRSSATSTPITAIVVKLLLRRIACFEVEECQLVAVARWHERLCHASRHAIHVLGKRSLNRILARSLRSQIGPHLLTRFIDRFIEQSLDLFGSTGIVGVGDELRRRRFRKIDGQLGRGNEFTESVNGLTSGGSCSAARPI